MCAMIVHRKQLITDRVHDKLTLPHSMQEGHETLFLIGLDRSLHSSSRGLAPFPNHGHAMQP